LEKIIENLTSSSEDEDESESEDKEKIQLSHNSISDNLGMDFNYDSQNNDVEIEFPFSNAKGSKESSQFKNQIEKRNHFNQIFSSASKNSNFNFLNIGGSSNKKSIKVNNYHNNISNSSSNNKNFNLNKLYEFNNEDSLNFNFGFNNIYDKNNKNIHLKNEYSKRSFLEKLNFLASANLNKDPILTKNNWMTVPLQSANSNLKISHNQECFFTFGKSYENQNNNNIVNNIIESSNKIEILKDPLVAAFEDSNESKEGSNKENIEKFKIEKFENDIENSIQLVAQNQVKEKTIESNINLVSEDENKKNKNLDNNQDHDEYIKDNKCDNDIENISNSNSEILFRERENEKRNVEKTEENLKIKDNKIIQENFDEYEGLLLVGCGKGINQDQPIEINCCEIIKEQETDKNEKKIQLEKSISNTNIKEAVFNEESCNENKDSTLKQRLIILKQQIIHSRNNEKNEK